MLSQIEFVQRERIGDRKAALKRCGGLSRAGQHEAAQQNGN
jgi:hypothetical protein